MEEKSKPLKSGRFILGRLQNLYCSCQSEFSAFLLFNYQSLILKRHHPRLAGLLEEFSKQHLKNSRELGSLILGRRGLPFYINSQKSPMTAFWIMPEARKDLIVEIDKNFLSTMIQNYDLTLTKIFDSELKSSLLTFQNCSKNFLSRLMKFFEG